jgi:hypothetical protein
MSFHDLKLNKYNLTFEYRDNTPPSTPERVRAAAQQYERDQRVMDSPEQRRIPHPPPPFPMVPPMVPPPIPQFSHLPANLQQQLAALPPLNPVRGGRGRGRGRGRGAPVVPASAPAFALAPAFELAPAPAPVPVPIPAPVPAPSTTHYQHLPPHLAQQLATLPSLPQLPQRGRVRRSNNRNTPAPLLFEEIAVQHAALPHVCFSFFLSFNIKLIYLNHLDCSSTTSTITTTTTTCSSTIC